jgi:hypothetical protein
MLRRVTPNLVKDRVEEVKQPRKRRSKIQAKEVVSTTATEDATVEVKPKRQRRKAQDIKSNTHTNMCHEWKADMQHFLSVSNIQWMRVVIKAR